MKIKIIAKVFMGLLFLSEFMFGMPGPVYTVESVNTAAIKVAMAQTNNATIDILPFDTNSSIEKPSCRLLVSMGSPNEYSSYIENAFKTELAMGGMLNGNSPIKIKGTVQKIESSAAVYAPYWSFDVELASSNGKVLRVTSKYQYKPEWNGDEACRKMKLAVYPATRKLIYEILTNPEFIQLVR